MKQEDIYKETKLHNTTDAKVWTDEFFKTLGQLYPFIGNYFNSSKGSHYYVEFTYWVFGWFCNAIQTAIDLTCIEKDKRYVYILQSNSGAIIKVWNNGFEPSEDELNEAYNNWNNIVDGGSAATNCTLYRWNRYEGLEHWNGKAVAQTIYNWNRVN